MADDRAIMTVCEAVVGVLREAAPARRFGHDLEFRVFLAKDFAAPISAGVSLFLYRVFPNGTARRPPGRLSANGERQRPQLPVDLHFLLTAWAGEASLQHALMGWLMRTMEDTPILPAALLNTFSAGTFRGDEAVEVVPADLASEDLLKLWADLVENAYQLSVPYVARNVYIESRLVLTEGEPVQARTLDYRQMPAAAIPVAGPGP